ncbi:uncharacterized protein V1516DRAFT_535436 [Lipomyces oligophaga]|uniref:uncharacterized protein n=1 Tax=Lipomyces oligophaga TaxID=45792 RepID=UPI0034CE4F3F
MFTATPSGFKDAPIIKFCIGFSLISAVVVSILGIKHQFFFQFDPHIWKWGQWWRLLVWQLIYLNESEILFSSLLFYDLRGIERLLGSRKLASLLLVSYGFSLVVTPVLLVFAKIIPFYKGNYLPAGPTPIIFTLLALYHHMVPSVYKFRFSPYPIEPVSEPGQGSELETEPPINSRHSLTVSDKIFVYIIAAQLALSQMPGSLIVSFTGWIIGILWYREVLPLRSWRIPESVWNKIRLQGRARLAALGTVPQQDFANLAALQGVQPPNLTGPNLRVDS